MPSPAYLVELAKFFKVSTDYLLGLGEIKPINVEGLSDKDIGILTELAERLKN